VSVRGHRQAPSRSGDQSSGRRGWRGASIYRSPRAQDG
jgi:hypothetical protein